MVKFILVGVIQIATYNPTPTLELEMIMIHGGTMVVLKKHGMVQTELEHVTVNTGTMVMLLVVFLT